MPALSNINFQLLLEDIRNKYLKSNKRFQPWMVSWLKESNYNNISEILSIIHALDSNLFKKITAHDKIALITHVKSF